MKSYLRFLSRNKLYTVIEVAGLSVALAFVLLLGNVVITDISCDRMIKDKETLYVCRTDESLYFKLDPEVVFPQIADITDWCNVATHNAFDGKTQFIHTPDGRFRQDIEPVTVRKNFFEFFGLGMVSGEASEVMETRNAAVISESLAAQIWPDADPVGRTLLLTEARFDDLELVITGVYKSYERSTLPDNGLVVRFDYITEVENRSDKLPSFMSSMTPSSVHYVRLPDGADTEAIEMFLLEKKQSDPLAASAPFKAFELQPYPDIHYDKRVIGSDNVRNVVDKGIYGTFTFACLILLAFAGLNYISLTMAFSRFRVKEMATRQLLGTSRSGIIGRCIAEASLLVTASWLFAASLAFALQPKVSSLLHTQISLYNTSAEWLLSIGIIVVMTLLAGFIPAVSILRHKPMEVVKGESRHIDKAIVGKLFIGLEGALSIASVAVTLAVMAQTAHMVNTPMGYNTEGLVYINFGSYKEQKFEDELMALSCVEVIGHIYAAPTQRYGIMEYLTFEGGETLTIKGNSGDEAAFRMLGFEVIEDYGTSSMNRFGATYKTMVCESTVHNLEAHIKDNKISTVRPKQIDGVIRDFRMGNVKNAEASAGYYFSLKQSPERYDNILVKVKGDVNEGISAMEDMYSGLKPANQQPKIQSLEDMVKDCYEEEQRILAMVGLFAVLSILMTIMAIIALSSYYVQMQTKDVAIRKSFGCSRRRIFAEMSIGFIWPVLAGCILAIPAAWVYIGHWLGKYPERVDNAAWLYIAALVAILLVVILTISCQATRLMNTNPASELKKE